jgi:hypothetical protein
MVDGNQYYHDIGVYWNEKPKIPSVLHFKKPEELISEPK